MEISELGRRPIAAGRPAGSDVRYAPNFDELQAELDKLSSPAAAGSLDWEKVVRLGAEILERHSKDLLVASYLAVALIHTRKQEGFALGLAVYLELVEGFWEELYPQKSRMRGRLRAVEWWIEKTEAALEQVRELSWLPADLVPLMENLDRLEGFLARNLQDSPSLTPIRECLDMHLASAPEPGKAEVPAELVREPGTEAACGVPGAAEEAGGGAPEEAEIPAPQKLAPQKSAAPPDQAGAFDEALLSLGEASSSLWRRDPASPHPYRIRRQVSWHAVDELPQSSEGRTRIPPPSSQEMNLLLGLAQGSDPEALLTAAEPRQTQFIFWIDLSRMVANALDLLGNRYRKAHDAVCQETAFLLHRLPGLEELSFSDGTPFATRETRNWLKRIALRPARPSLPDPHHALSAPEPGAEVVIEKKIRELEELVRMGQLVEAMEVVQQKLRTSSSRRENLLWRLSLSQMLVDLGQSRLALPHLEQVLEDIEGHGLKQYDPSLAMRGFRLAWIAFDGQEEQKFKDRALEILHQIGRFDMPEMVRLTTG